MKKSTWIKGAALGLSIMAIGNAAFAAPGNFERFSDELSEEAQAIVEEAKELREAGDREGARDLIETIKPELEAIREAHKAERQANREAIKAAMASGDYQAWLEALGAAGKTGDWITEENFEKLQEAHDLKEAGDREGAVEIKKEVFGDDFKPHKRGGKDKRGGERPERGGETT